MDRNISWEKIKAPDFSDEFEWTNISSKLSLDRLKGQIVLLDFWTYCCINCIHTISDLQFLEEKYKNEPFQVIGIHSAKFTNENIPKSVQSAIARYGIKHPVLMDHNHILWNSYAVRGWPTLFLIDSEGYLRSEFSGEGHLEEIDLAIKTLIDEGNINKSLKYKPKYYSDIPNQSSLLLFPGKIEIDEEENILYISDTGHNRILITKLSQPDKAEVVSIIGTGKIGFDDGEFKKATFKNPQGMAIVESVLFVCDTGNHAIRAVDLEKHSVLTVSGNGCQAPHLMSGGLGIEVMLNSPWDMDYYEDALYIAMAGSHQIWRFNLSSQFMETYAGDGYEEIVDAYRLRAELAQPSGISISGETLYFLDSESSSLREINFKKDLVHTIIGTGLFDFGYKDGSLIDSYMQHPIGIYADKDSIFVADTFNNAIREVNLANNDIKTIIGRDSSGTFCRIDDKNCDILPLYEPNDVIKKDNYLYIADTNNHLIRVYDLRTSILSDLDIKR